MIILLIYGGASSEHDVSIKSKDYIKQILTSLGYKTKELFGTIITLSDTNPLNEKPSYATLFSSKPKTE